MRPRILIVGGEERTRESIDLVVGRFADTNVTELYSEGVRELESREREYNAVVTSLRKDEEYSDGLSVLKEAIDSYEHLPVFMIAGDANPELVEDARIIGNCLKEVKLIEGAFSVFDLRRRVMEAASNYTPVRRQDNQKV
jgi:DNA-binding NtrC family response regulator